MTIRRQKCESLRGVLTQAVERSRRIGGNDRAGRLKRQRAEARQSHAGLRSRPLACDGEWHNRRLAWGETMAVCHGTAGLPAERYRAFPARRCICWRFVVYATPLTHLANALECRADGSLGDFSAGLMGCPFLASLAQLAEQRTLNPKVGGSIPLGGTSRQLLWKRHLK